MNIVTVNTPTNTITSPTVKMRLDLELWNAERKRVEVDLRELKKAMRAPGHNVTPAEAYGYSLLKSRASGLYMLRMFAKGTNRLHHREKVVYSLAYPKGRRVPFTLEDQTSVASRFLPSPLSKPDDTGHVGYWKLAPQ